MAQILWTGKTISILNVRSSPYILDDNKIGVLQNGASVNVVAVVGDWLQIEWAVPAYVYCSYVKKDVESNPSSYVLGIDISRWNDNNSTPQQCDFKKAKAAGAEFVFIKSSQANWQDEDILYNWKNAKSAGLLRGAYHFMTWDVKPETQVEFMWNLIKSDAGELPPVIDFEWWGNKIPSNGIQMLWAFVVRLEAMCGRRPIIYTAPGWWTQYGASQDWARYPLWQAQYNSKPDPLLPWGTNWTFWQYTSNGDGLRFGCESKDVDLNYFNGDLEALYKFANVEQTVPELSDHEILMILKNAHPELF